MENMWFVVSTFTLKHNIYAAHLSTKNCF